MDLTNIFTKSILESLDSDIVKWIHTLNESDYVKMLTSCYHETKAALNKQVIGQIEIEDKKRLELLKNINKKLEVGEPLNEEEKEVINKSNNIKSYYPSIIGKKAEDSFELLCKRLSNQYNILSTAKIGKQGDFIIEYSNNGMLYKCLVDIKNYEKTVPKKEIDKFYEDLNYGSYNAGLILSKKSKFTGISENIYVSDVMLSYDRLPVMFLSSLSNELIIKCIEILFFKITVIKEKKFDYMQVENILMNINNTLEHSSLTRRILKEHQDSTMDAVAKSLNNLNSLEQKINDSINYINIIIHKSEKLELTKANLENIGYMNNMSGKAELLDDSISIISYETTDSIKTSSTIEGETMEGEQLDSMDKRVKKNEQLDSMDKRVKKNEQLDNLDKRVKKNEQLDSMDNLDNLDKRVKKNEQLDSMDNLDGMDKPDVNLRNLDGVDKPDVNLKMKRKLDELLKQFKNIKSLSVVEQNKMYNKYLPKYKPSDVKKLNGLFSYKWDIVLNNEISFIFIKGNVILFIDPFKSKSVVYLEFLDNNLSAQELSLKTYFKIGKSKKLKADMTTKLITQIYNLIYLTG